MSSVEQWNVKGLCVGVVLQEALAVVDYTSAYIKLHPLPITGSLLI